MSREDDNNRPPTFAAAGSGSLAGNASFVLETLLIVALMASLEWEHIPDVGEAQYFAKAKKFWNPLWCQGDFFLESADAHGVFFASFGWITRCLPLDAATAAARLAVWATLAAAWTTLVRTLLNRRTFGAALLSCGAMILLIQHGHMAGEWIVGGVEAKGIAYALVFWAISQLVQRRWGPAWFLLGAATAFHVLVGGWALAASCGVWACGERRLARSDWGWLAAAALLVLLGVVPALALSWGVDPETKWRANYIYVKWRLPHHLLIHRFPPQYLLRHALLVVVWGVSSWCLLHGLDAASPLRLRYGRFLAFLAAALAITAAGLTIDQTTLGNPRLAVSLLRYYWFRLSDVLIPAGMAFNLVLACQQLATAARRELRIGAGVGRALLATVLVAAVAAHLNFLVREPRPAAARQAGSKLLSSEEAREQFLAWREACRWIAAHTPPDARFLTPRYQQTFHWYAERAEVVNWKDVPQDSASIFAWWQRFGELYPRSVRRRGLAGHGEKRLLELADKYQADYLVVDQRRARRQLSQEHFQRLFPAPGKPDGLYTVYRIREAPAKATAPPLRPTTPAIPHEEKGQEKEKGQAEEG